MAIVDRIANKPLAIIKPPLDTPAEQRMVDVMTTLKNLLGEQRESLFVLIDMRGIPVNFDAMIQNLNMVRQENHLLAHPMLRELIVISAQQLITRGVKGLDSAVYGNLRLKVFPELEDAVKYVDTQGAST